MVQAMGNVMEQPLAEIRNHLKGLDENKWVQALGEREGKVYRKVWRILEGLE